MPKKPKVEDLEIQISELKEALQRERADAINVRRRYDAQLAGLQATVQAGVIEDLLPVVDNMERALAHTPEDIQGHDYVKGVSSVVKQFTKTLSNLGVERIKTVGEAFNPELHEAVSMEDAGGKQEIVSEELQSGYKLGDQIIRHAMVRVKK